MPGCPVDRCLRAAAVECVRCETESKVLPSEEGDSTRSAERLSRERVGELVRPLPNSRCSIGVWNVL